MDAAGLAQPVRSLLPIALLLTLAGGYLDAYSWAAHGHVFSNAQTGNVVYFGLYAAAGDWRGAFGHLLPVAAFILGVLAAKLLGVQPVKHTFHATLLCQGCELATLAGLFLLRTRISDSWFVPAIAFVAALQTTSFGALGSLTFSSAVTTTNLLNSVSGLFAWLHTLRQRLRNLHDDGVSANGIAPVPQPADRGDLVA